MEKAQVQKAVEALVKFIGKKQSESTSLFSDDEELVYLVSGSDFQLPCIKTRFYIAVDAL